MGGGAILDTHTLPLFQYKYRNILFLFAAVFFSSYFIPYKISRKIKNSRNHGHLSSLFIDPLCKTRRLPVMLVGCFPGRAMMIFGFRRQMHEEAWWRFIIINVIAVGFYAIYAQYNASDKCPNDSAYHRIPTDEIS